MGKTETVQGQRLVFARKQAGYDTARSAAEALGVPYPTYAGHENGSRGFLHSAGRYALFFKVRSQWLWEGVGPIKPGQQHPVVELYERIPPEKRAEALDYLSYLASRKS